MNRETVEAIITKCRLYTGDGFNDIESGMFQAEVDLLLNEILTRHKDLTEAQLFEISDKGLRGEYGEYTRISVKVILTWIRGYVSEQRAKPSKPLALNSYAPTQEEIDQYSEKLLGIAIKKIKSGENYDDYGNLLWRYLVRSGEVDADLSHLNKRAEIELLKRNNQEKFNAGELQFKSVLEKQTKNYDKDLDSIKMKLAFIDWAKGK